MNTPNTQARWYSLDATGMATLCRGEQDAIHVAADNNIQWPNLAPHRAVMLAPVDALASQPAQSAQFKAVHQFRKVHCSDWYDGHADHSDGKGPYEERTLYTQPAQAWAGVDEDEAPVVDVAKANDYDRIAHLARLRRYALEEIAGSKSLTATPAQEARHYQRIAQRCLDDAGAQAAHIAAAPATPQAQPAPVAVDERELDALIDAHRWDTMDGRRSLVRAALQSCRSGQANTDVRSILLDVVPGDGDGYEVYAKSCDDVVAKLTEMGARIEELELARSGQPAAVPASQAVEDDSIRKLIAAHGEMLEVNPYCYFELAYTRQTEWMAWVCSKPREDDPSRKVLAQGQGPTPDEAAYDALGCLARAAIAANKEAP